jgi:hypothetical protein
MERAVSHSKLSVWACVIALVAASALGAVYASARLVQWHEMQPNHVWAAATIAEGEMLVRYILEYQQKFGCLPADLSSCHVTVPTGVVINADQWLYRIIAGDAFELCAVYGRTAFSFDILAYRSDGTVPTEWSDPKVGITSYGRWICVTGAEKLSRIR